MDAMGSTYTVILYGDDREAMLAAVGATFDEVDRLERLLSAYRPDSELSLLNRRAGERPVQVSRELFELLSRCLEYSRKSDGAFDISVGSLLKTWGFQGGTGHMPTEAEEASARRRVGYRHIHLDPSTLTVRFTLPGLELDPGGIGKGYAVDRMAAILRQRGFTTALLAAASSTIYGMGVPPDEPRGWHATIRHPAHPLKSIAEVFLHNMSLSTSGTSEKFFTAGGQVYSHIMDPQTGRPARGVMVAVEAPSNIDSEAWTKAYFVNGRAWAASHPQEAMRVFYCDGGDESTYGWLV